MGVAEINEKEMLLFIKAHIVLYGDAANKALAQLVANEIETYWSEPKATVTIKGQQLLVQFKITAEYKSSLQPEEVFANTNPLFNYFRVEEYSVIDISFVDGLGCNTGYFKLLNLSNGSTTAAAMALPLLHMSLATHLV